MRPRIITRPVDGRVTPASNRSMVDLPAPLRPMMPMVSPGATHRSASRKAQSSVRFGGPNGMSDRTRLRSWIFQ